MRAQPGWYTGLKAQVVDLDSGKPSQSTRPGVISLVVVSPNAPYRQALVDLLQQQPGMVVQAPQPSVAAGLGDSIDHPPALAIVDSSGIENVLQARKTWPNAVILCLLDYISDWDFVKSLGADTCVLKDRGGTVLLDAISALGESLRRSE